VGLEKNALLAHRGISSTAIPLRLDTGDIILCNTSDLRSYGTKIFTRSQWDHMAIVVRWWNNELRLLEATSDEGVEAYNLDHRLEYLLSVSKIGVRCLRVSRTPEMMDALYRLIDEVLGRPFERSRMSLLRAAGNMNSTVDLSSLFCSELVAEAYKRMGLVEQSKPSNNYLPKVWADKTNAQIPLAKGVYIERKFVFRNKVQRLRDLQQEKQASAKLRLTGSTWAPERRTKCEGKEVLGLSRA